ncbi:hypothetical protein Taro_054502 [Colocasia esculenta]|uniref:Uncharacterized protein n=1 Tax=Colocasia esculenta TaxID=4460 RepID=A0A843XQS1_COLES|nr:hypothetical protein [Colocasia esculenta]
MRVVAADQAGNDELERGVRGTFLGFQRDSRFFGGLLAFLRIGCRLYLVDDNRCCRQLVHAVAQGLAVCLACSGVVSDLYHQQ